jgi:hypothetical protein
MWSMDESAPHRMDMHKRLAQGRARMGYASLR